MKRYLIFLLLFSGCDIIADIMSIGNKSESDYLTLSIISGNKVLIKWDKPYYLDTNTIKALLVRAEEDYQNDYRVIEDIRGYIFTSCTDNTVTSGKVYYYRLVKRYREVKTYYQSNATKTEVSEKDTITVPKGIYVP
ncbi:MAG: hypothetical protein N2258_00705 [Brevinematales bacterium]|nr:hypothetical protein [Brevinematales bacterium]